MKARANANRDPSSQRFRNRLVSVLAAGGLGLLAYLITELGPSRIAAQLRGLGSILPAVLIVTGAKYALQAAGWRLLLPRDTRPPWGESISATIAGDALGYLTWAGPFTGEPIRALLIRDSVPVAAGIAAGAVERTIYNITAAILVWAVLLAVLSSVHAIGFAVALAGSVLVAATIVLARYRRRAQLVEASLSATLNEPPARAARAGKAVAFLDAARQLWRTRRGVLPAIACLCVAQHAILVGEAYLMLGALAGPTTLQTALVFEAVTKIVNTVGLLVPGRLGVAEGGSALLADALGFAASHGLSLALMRRVRALIWSGVGLALLPFREARARRAPQ